MRVFVKYDHTGEILAVSAVEALAETTEQPYGTLGAGEAVLEVAPKSKLGKLEPIQIHEGFMVDVKKKKLVAKA